MSNANIVIAKYKKRLLHKKFIPVELIARNPLYYGYGHLVKQQESNARQNDFINSTSKITAAISANRCLGKDQLIYNPILNKSIKVSDIKNDFYVYSYSNGKKIISKANKPFIKDKQNIYKITFKNKQILNVSMNHLILDSSGTYQPVSKLIDGVSIFLYQSNLVLSLLIHILNVMNYFQKVLNYLKNCFFYFYLYGERLRFSLIAFLGIPTLLNDVQLHKYYEAFVPLDDLVYKSKYNHLYRLSYLHSIQDVFLHCVDQFFSLLYSIFYKCKNNVDEYILKFFQFLQKSYHYQSFLSSVYKYKKSFVLPFLNTSATIITNIEYIGNDYVWDFEVPIYNNYFIGNIVNHNSGKSECGAVKTLKICLTSKIGGRFWVITPSYDSQKSGAQEKILEYLKPSNIRHKSHATGKALRDITLTNDVTIEFKTVEQGREKLQSAKLIGCWFDEEPPLDIYEEVYARTLDYAAQVIMTFTPLKGFTWSYEKIFNAVNNNINIFSWGMIDNPFIPISEIEQLKQTLSYKQAQIRIYGRYMGNETAVYQIFDRSTHINNIPMYNPELPVDMTIDFGVVTSAVIFGQYQKTVDKKTKKITDRFVIVDAMEMNDTGYATMMRIIFQRISQKGYTLGSWYCDPAGRQRQQGSKTGTSLLELIRTEFGVQFNYIKRLSIEESIELVSSYMVNAQQIARFFLDCDIAVNKNGNTLSQRIEQYVRDDETHKPIDDDRIHLLDCLRYYIANKVKGNLRGKFLQH